MLGRRSLTRVAQFALAMFLLAQGALAMAACNRGEHSAARAVAHAAGSSNEAPCHESDTPALDAGLCVAHCVLGDQSLDKPAYKLPVVAGMPALPVLASLAPTAGNAAARYSVPRVAGPPPRILFQTFLN